MSTDRPAPPVQPIQPMNEVPPAGAPSASRSIWSRMWRAAMLDSRLYEEVEADQSATMQALAVVVIVSVVSGLGSGIAAIVGNETGFASFLGWFVLSIATALLGWLAWSAITFVLGTTLFKAPQTEATVGQLMRTLGFSNTPRLLAVFLFIPFIGWILSLVGSIWALVAGVIAVRHALDFSTWRALGTVITGWIIYMLLAFLVSLVVPGI